MTLRFGDPYYGPGSPGYDYATYPVQTDYTDQLTSSPTYPGAGSPSSYIPPEPQTPVIYVSGANWVSPPPLVPVVGSDSSEWNMPNFKAPSSPWLAMALVAVGAGALWYASR